MAGLQPTTKCFRCGGFGHVQLACPNPLDPDAKKMANQQTRAQRTGEQHWDYQERYNLRREAFLKYNGTVASLHPMVSWEIDQLLDVKQRLEDVDIQTVNHLTDSALQLSALKDEMEQRLPGLRELLYTSKHHHDRKDALFSEKLHNQIFQGHTQDLEMLRQAVWEHLWRTERHISFGNNLLPEIRRIKGRMAAIRWYLLQRENLRTEGISPELMEELHNLDRDGSAALEKLFNFCPDPRIMDERDYFNGLVLDIQQMDRTIKKRRNKVDPRGLKMNLEGRYPPIGSPF